MLPRNNEELSLKIISEKLRGTELSPDELSNIRMWLAGQYGYTAGRLSIILSEKPAIWNEMRRSFKSDTATERCFQQTPKGIEESNFRLELKVIEKLMSAIKSRLEILMGEARNQY